MSQVKQKVLDPRRKVARVPSQANIEVGISYSSKRAITVNSRCNETVLGFNVVAEGQVIERRDSVRRRASG
jgi:hypothetical protein